MSCQPTPMLQAPGNHAQLGTAASSDVNHNCSIQYITTVLFNQILSHFSLLCWLCRAVLAADGPEVTQKVFFDVSVGGQSAGRIVIGLFGEWKQQQQQQQQ